MSDLAHDPFSVGRLQGDVRQLRSDVDRISDIVEGREGMQIQFTRLLSKLDTQEETRDREHKANTARLNIIIGIAGLVGAWVIWALTVWHHL